MTLLICFVLSELPYVHTHRAADMPIDKSLPSFGDVVVVHQALKKPPSFENRRSTGICLGGL